MNKQQQSLEIQLYQGKELYKTYPINESGRYRVGRSQNNHIIVDDPGLSRHHLDVIWQSSQLEIIDHSSYGSTINGEKMANGQAVTVPFGSRVYLTGQLSLAVNIVDHNHLHTNAQTEVVSCVPEVPEQQGIEVLARLRQSGRFTIGRSSNCDLTIPSLQVSRQHAVLTWNNNVITLQDMDTTNGTFVNGELIEGSTTLNESDEISIGSHIIRLSGTAISKPLAIVARNIEKIYPKGNVGLHRMSLSVQSNEFVALMGPSGCGKSTLLKCLNGANPVTSGEILIQGLKLNNKNFNTLKKHIGYVPQDDIVHRELTVRQTLYYAAKLRMASDVSNQEITGKIHQVLTSLNLPDVEVILPKRISELSGGQRKRISIAVELLNDPSILFLDEPTSPLDPETIEEFLTCIRGLAEHGQTIIMVTHKPSDLNKVDKVIFLSKGGYQTFYGDKNELEDYFKAQNINEIYSKLKSEDEGSRWNQILNKESHGKAIPADVEVITSKTDTSLSRQFYWLSRRYLNIKWNDHFNLMLLMLQPVIIALLLIFIFAHLQLSVFFMMAISAVWFGVSNASKEIVSELAIYERERMYNLNIFVYILSKVSVLSIVALIQVCLFVGIVYTHYSIGIWQSPETVELWSLAHNIAFMFFLSVSATVFGLLLSALFTNSEKVMTIVPIALMPQIMLAGIIAPVDSNVKVLLSYLTLGRWGTEGFAHAQDSTAKEGGHFADPAQEIPASVMQLLPSTSQSGVTMELQPQGAIDQLGLYNSNKELISIFPESLTGVIVAVSLLTAIFFVGIYMALKNKDSRFS